ncbi:glycosyltransferase [Priestia megaterium]|uniref:glycosyltransferase n=1 Tax=Priestia megaterium TaxID=1404 RepID=UPI00249C2581|nr:glycosyltransferase [Priestia megaterium]MDI3089732.1 glycosyltransferase [Priestia megaterium]
MKKKIIVEIHFNAFGFTPDRFEKKWIDHRMDLFMKYAVSSLKKQTNQDFLTLVRYEDSTEKLIKEALARYKKLPSNIKFVNKAEHMNGLKESCQSNDYIYIVRLDSDDLYHKTYIQQLHDYKPKKDTEVLINQNGYLYDSVTGRIAHYYHFSPQFYVYIYKSDEYLEGKRYRPGGHGNVIKKFKYELLKNRNYVNVIHKQNVSNKRLGTKDTNTGRVDAKNIITDPKKVRDILKEFM